MFQKLVQRNWLWVVLSTVSLSIANLFSKVALTGVFFLILSLLPNNLLFFKWPIANSFWQTLTKYRRDFGITAGILFLAHSISSTNSYVIKGDFSRINQLFTLEIFFGLISSLIITLMLLTSNQWSVRIMKRNWKKLHILIWLVVILGLFHGIFATSLFSGEISVISIIGFGILIVVGVLQVFRKRYTPIILMLLGLTVVVVLSLTTFFQPAKAFWNRTFSSSSTSTSSTNSEKTYSIQELKSNSTETSCWVAYQNQVFDLTNYLYNHPGGARELIRFCGKEIDNQSASHPGGSFNSKQIQEILNSRKIGKLQK